MSDHEVFVVILRPVLLVLAVLLELLVVLAVELVANGARDDVATGSGQANDRRALLAAGRRLVRSFSGSTWNDLLFITFVRQRLANSLRTSQQGGGLLLAVGGFGFWRFAFALAGDWEGKERIG